MICPEGENVQKEMVAKDEKEKFGHVEGTGSLELNSYKNPKNWKKSLTNFFRNQLRSTKSNDGERPSGSENNFEERAITTDQKWQSLGKVFRRQSVAENWQKSPNQQASTSHNKRHSVRKVFSSYFGKSQKCPLDKNNEEH